MLSDQKINEIWYANSYCEYPREYQMKAIRAVAEAAVKAEREGQEPVAWRVAFTTPVGVDSLIVSRREDAENQVRSELILSVEPLYTTPPAAPVPEGYVLVPQAWLVSLASVDFGHGDIWSDAAETAAAGMRAMLAASQQEVKS